MNPICRFTAPASRDIEKILDRSALFKLKIIIFSSVQMTTRRNDYVVSDA
jgi:hypothetical protein